MRIDDTSATSSNLQQLQVGRTEQTQLDPKTRARTSGDGRSEGDVLSLSALGSQIAQSLAQDSPQEIARVSETQRAVEAGGFQEPAPDVADSLIDAALTETAFEQQLAPGSGASAEP